jgi:2-keto-3-deoxy-L-rhamnonate aldolase RhmA
VYAVGSKRSRAGAGENFESIGEVVGIGDFVPGPNDLAAGLDKLGRIDVPVVTVAIDNATMICQAGDVRLGYFDVERAIELFRWTRTDAQRSR